MLFGMSGFNWVVPMLCQVQTRVTVAGLIQKALQEGGNCEPEEGVLVWCVCGGVRGNAACDLPAHAKLLLKDAKARCFDPQTMVFCNHGESCIHAYGSGHCKCRFITSIHITIWHDTWYTC